MWLAQTAVVAGVAVVVLTGCGGTSCEQVNALRCHGETLEVCDLTSGWKVVQPCGSQGRVCTTDPALCQDVLACCK